MDQALPPMQGERPLDRQGMSSDSNLETPHQHFQLMPQTCQLDARRSGLITGTRGLLGDITHIDHAAGDLLGHGAMLLCHRGNLLIHQLNSRYRAGDIYQRSARSTSELHTVFTQQQTALHT